MVLLAPVITGITFASTLLLFLLLLLLLLNKEQQNVFQDKTSQPKLVSKEMHNHYTPPFRGAITFTNPCLVLKCLQQRERERERERA